MAKVTKETKETKELNAIAKPWLSMFMKDEKNIQGSMVKGPERIYTPSPSLNWSLPMKRGYSICLYGPEGSGKSLISMIAIGAIHQSDPDAWAVLITTEMRAPTPERLRTLGVDPARLLIRQANTLHDVFDWISSMDDKFTNSDGSKGGPGLSYAIDMGMPVVALVIDSIKGISGPREMAADTVEKEIMGDLSKFLNPALRSMLPVIRKGDGIYTFLVQQVNINMDADEVKYQNKKYIIPSGQSLKHFCEQMALIEKVTSKDSKVFDESMKSIRDLPVQMGHTIRVRTEKDNLGKPNREAQFRLHYDRGIIDVGLEVATLAAGLGIIYHPLNDKGSPIVAQWVFGDKKWIGFANCVKEIEENLEIRRAIIKAIESTDTLQVTETDIVLDTDTNKK